MPVATTVVRSCQDVYGNAGGATIFAGSQVIKSGGSASNTTVAGGGTLGCAQWRLGQVGADFGRRCGGRQRRRY